MIELRAITRQYHMGDQTVQALRGVDLHIARNELVAIIGASGSGKSTMMNIIGCLDSPRRGAYPLDGRDVAAWRGRAGARAQSQNRFCLPEFSICSRAAALENVMQPLIYRGMRRANARAPRRR